MSTWGSFIARQWTAARERLTRRLRHTNREMSIESLHRKIDLMWRDVEFIRTHASSYVGNNTSLTHLVDETPIFVNANDYGGPTNLINGGRYEEQNLTVLLSYVRPDSVFLDIGANLGFFALRVGQRLHMQGQVHAFEPHPLLTRLLTQSVFLNGLIDTIRIHNYGLSDTNQKIEFGYPHGHLGGGSVSFEEGDTRQRIESEVKRLDDVFGADFTCDLVKIDVEGHELAVLKGMARILGKSPQVKVMFEKLGISAGYEQELFALLTDMNFKLFSIEPDATLRKLTISDLSRFSGYVLASRDECVGDLNRNRISLFPGQIITPTGHTVADGTVKAIHIVADTPQILFHGPYWFLPRGVWRYSLVGENPTGLKVTVAARFGIPVAEFTLEPGETEKSFIAETDLKQFELIGRPLSSQGSVLIERIDLHRIA